MTINKKNIKTLSIVTTTHSIGKKQILLNSQETSTSLTQIAVTQLKAGETAEAVIIPCDRL